MLYGECATRYLRLRRPWNRIEVSGVAVKLSKPPHELQVWLPLFHCRPADFCAYEIGRSSLLMESDAKLRSLD
jgi:hypothetical protein